MSIPGLDRWLATAPGRYVAAWEEARYGALVEDVFGYNALQIGLPQLDLLARNRIPLRQRVGLPATAGGVDVNCDPRQLPFAAGSIDLVVLPHVLEFSAEPHQILREVERVLIPQGQLLLSGFNPYSLWGLRRRLPGCPGDFPWNGSYLSVQRMKDWLQLLGFDVDRGAFGCYVPPFRSEGWLRRWRFMEAAGDRWWSFGGGIYILRAVKRVHGMRLILPAWGPPKARRKALGALTQKETTHHEH